MTDAWVEQLVRGTGGTIPPLRELRAGSTRALLDGIDLRYIRCGSREVVRRVYVAVRDDSWKTIPADYRIIHVEQGPSTFEVELEARHSQGNLKFAWRGTISGDSTGTITYRMAGVAESSFAYNRIGLCILHPSDMAGGRYVSWAGSENSAGSLPELIGPQANVDGVLQPLIQPFDRLTIEHADLRVDFGFSGDEFEMEDQRNWTDASFKTYSTPLALGFPHASTAGQAIEHSVVIAASCDGTTIEPPGPLSMEIGDVSRAAMPRLGFGMATHGEVLSGREISLLQEIRPDHLRVDVRLNDTFESDVLMAVDVARALKCALEPALYLREEDAPKLETLIGMLPPDVPTARVLVFSRGASSGSPDETTPAALLDLVRSRVSMKFPGVPLVGGSDFNFCELNRTRPRLDVMDGISFPINAQVHASDDTSVMETTSAQIETIRSARSFAGESPVIVSPITLKARSGGRAARESIERGHVPDSVDARQMSCLGAAWTLASLASLVDSGAQSLTYFETTGWFGLMERAAGSPLPDVFPSTPGMVFPLYHVFADLATRAEGRAILCKSSDPITVMAFGIDYPSHQLIFIANLTNHEQSVSVGPLSGTSVLVRTLDVTTVRSATLEPGKFRQTGHVVDLEGDRLTLTLRSYASARIEVTTRPERSVT